MHGICGLRARLGRPEGALYIHGGRVSLGSTWRRCRQLSESEVGSTNMTGPGSALARALQDGGFNLGWGRRIRQYGGRQTSALASVLCSDLRVW